MDYTQALQYIRSLGRFGIKPGLERVRLLCQVLGNPQNKLNFIHVAGTNGKGSTCAMLANICKAAGRKTGLYTSPYVIEYRECMQIDGEMISEADFGRWVETLRDSAVTLPEPVTEYEFITAMAFAWFCEQGCDVVVLEVGMGGRWDATNVIPAPLCSVITKISYDHMEYLGNTLAKIAGEKCGIIKPGCPVITTCEQPEEALTVIQSTAKLQGCKLTIAEETQCEIISSDIAGSEVFWAGLHVHVPLLGQHMCRNALTAILTARLLNLPDKAIQAGIAATRIPARMELLSLEPLVLLDGGHNPDCAQALAAALAEHLSEQRLCAICGIMADKDAAAYLRILRPYINHLITCQPGNPRAYAANALAAIAREVGYENVTPAASVAEALRAAEHPLLICGSFYLAGEVRVHFSSAYS